ncbi:MAG: response regulator transcription factor [Lachnospiraceae bacterium]|nr:response regulator transcription factor [Lachnospiraceae bacterium]
MKLLIIEDEYRLADMLRDWFAQKGDKVKVCVDGMEGYKCALKESFDVIILDVMLPGKDGFSILSDLRKKMIKTPILILSARYELEDKLKGFKYGAEDYLTKPFHVEELDARVAILAKKARSTDNLNQYQNDDNCIRFANLSLDKNSHILKNVDSELSVALPSKEYTLMEYFLTNVNQLLSKEQITTYIWGYDTDVSYNNEEVYISFLRKKLRYLGCDITIETIRGSGYRLRDLNGGAV